jgi:hypothetical protein
VLPDTQRILDPSFGDGRFLVQAGRRLRDFGVPDPGARLFGCEINPVWTDDLRALELPRRHLVKKDFFASTPATLGGQFDAVVGNPPYVRHHLMSATDKQVARARMKQAEVELSERADAWAYFCTYLLGFLAPTGRMALVLPGSVLHADYAAPVIDAWARGERRVRLVRIGERLFEGVSERTVVLLVEQGQARCGVDFVDVADVPELSEVLEERSRVRSGWRRGVSASEDAGTSRGGRLQSRLRWFVDPAVATLWETLNERADVARLGDRAQIRIGVVTGANKFFVVDTRTAETLGPPGSEVRFIDCVSRNAWLRAPVWTRPDQRRYSVQACQLMIVPPGAALSSELLAAIREAEGRGLHERSHCAKRDPWYALDDSWAPDLFLPYMGSAAPPLVLNQAGSTCTNAVHRVSVEDRRDRIPLAAGSWTSLFRLSAELIGRSYGGGVLKIEPGEAADFRIPIPQDPQRVFREICLAYRETGAAAAIAVADRLILREQLGLRQGDVRKLRDAVSDLARRRTR